MGASARQRGDALIRSHGADRRVTVMQSYLSRLESYHLQNEELRAELRRANALIARVRAENKVLKEEKAKFISVVKETGRHISVAGNHSRKWVVGLVLSRLSKAKMI